MDIVRRQGPLDRPLSRLRHDIDDLLRRFFGEADWPLGNLRQGGLWWPALDVVEHDDNIVVKAELPGMTSDDIEISVLDGTLSVSGEKKESQEDTGESYHHSERRYGSFRRDISLPAGVDADKVEATYRDGVLTIRLPKTEQAKARRVEVKTG